jgi:hypothetical protein
MSIFLMLSWSVFSSKYHDVCSLAEAPAVGSGAPHTWNIGNTLHNIHKTEDYSLLWCVMWRAAFKNLLAPFSGYSFLGWGETESTWYIGHYLVYCTSPGMIGDGECEAVGGIIGRGNRSTNWKLAPLPLCLPQIPHYLTRGQTQAASELSEGGGNKLLSNATIYLTDYIASHPGRPSEPQSLQHWQWQQNNTLL